MIECAKQVVSDLHVVLYINGSKVVSCFISRFYFCSGMLKIPDDQSHNQALLLRLLICLVIQGPGSHHALLTQSCFHIMMLGLHFNICNRLPSSFLLDFEVANVQVEEKICDTLKYACWY